MADKVKIAENLVSIEFENHTLPNFVHQKGKEFVRFGDHNNYPDYLIELYNRNAIHGAIVKGKAAYVYGKGLSINPEGISVFEQAKTAQWLDTANQFEDWNTVYEKTARYLELFNGFAWQIIWSWGGTKMEVYCMEFSKLRRSPDGKKILYCDNWILTNGKANQSPDKDPSYKEFDSYNPNVRCGTQILYFKLDVPTTAKYGKLYPLPEYSGCIADVESDIEITSFHYNNLKNGMTASAMLSLFNGMPKTEEAKIDIARMIKGTHTGSLNAGKIMINFVDPQGQEAKLTTLTASDLDKQFDLLGKRLQQNIFTGHRVDPVLFGVMTEGSLANTSGKDILVKWDKFLRAYVEPRQQIILKEIKDLAEIVGVDLCNLEIKQTTPVGIDYTDPNISKFLSENEVRKGLGLDASDKNINPQVQTMIDQLNAMQPHVAALVIPAMTSDELRSLIGLLPTTQPLSGGTTNTPAPTQQAEINEHLKNLTGKQWININRIIRNVASGKMQRTAGSLMLKNGYGLNDQDIETLFSTPAQFKKFAKVAEDEIIKMFEACAIDECAEDTFISEDFVYTETDALKKELKLMKQRFDDAVNSPDQGAVLDQLNGNPTASPADLAKILGLPLDYIGTILESLVTSKLIEKASKGWSITPKGTEGGSPPAETEIYTVYKYVTRPGVPEVETTSRPFCKAMLALSASGKRWTRDNLDEITNNLGEDAWVFRGGFYTNPDTGDTTPYCRHIWKSIVKSRTKKK